ncbi:hypothetical protein EZS27_021081 [termite gut metagenome]|uniref:Uncharacterized protein n=1 Tax=termite gut metagenome TaxID=433724 RepID=A0A5J4RB37_9ZZZZ
MTPFLLTKILRFTQYITDYSIDMPKKEEVVEVVELDEMHTYVSSKKTIVGSGLPLIDSEKDLSLLSVEIVPQKRDSSFGKK